MGTLSALRRFLVDFDAAPALAAPALAAPALVAPALVAPALVAPDAALPAVSPAGRGGPVRPLFGPAPDATAEALPAAPAGDRTGAATAAAVATTVATAVAAAVAEARAEAEAVHGAALAAADARHAAALAVARRAWAAEEGAALASGFRSAVAALGEALGDAAGAALEPLVEAAARRHAADELRDAVADLVLAGPGTAISVSGPVDLVEGLRAGLTASGVGTESISFTASGAAEVVVTAEASRIETRLAAWSQALGRHVDGVAQTRVARTRVGEVGAAETIGEIGAAGTHEEPA